MSAAPPLSVSLLIADHISGVSRDETGKPALAAAKRSLLDAIGVSIAASGLEPACQPFRDIAIEQGRGSCTILGWGDRVSLSGAVSANGAMAHAIDFEDVYDRSPIHANSCTIAAALGVAQQRGGVSGKDLLAAIALGSDLVCRLALALKEDPSVHGWYIPPILGAYGATAAAARLMGLTAVQTVDAFAMTLSQVTCPTEFKRSPRSALRAIRDGFAASGAVMSAQLAVRGVAGFDYPFEGEAGLFALYAGGNFDSAPLVDDLGKRFYGEDVSFKAWPACRGTHAFIETALAIARDPDWSASEVISIEASGSAFLSFLAEPKEKKSRPATAIDAKFSIPFNVGHALVHGMPAIDSYGAEQLNDERILELSDLVTFRPIDGGFRDASAGALTVVLRNGRQLTRRVDFAYGHPSNPIAESELIAKFKSCAKHGARALDNDIIDRFLAALDTLEDNLSDGGSVLLDILYPESTS